MVKYEKNLLYIPSEQVFKIHIVAVDSWSCHNLIVNKCKNFIIMLFIIGNHKKEMSVYY